MKNGNQIKSRLRRHLWWIQEVRAEMERRKFLSQKMNWHPHMGKAPNVILISVDSMGAKHLSCYGYDRATSPTIDRLAKSGVLFENVIAQANWTKPSLASLHTSLYPSVHKTDSRGEAGDRVDERARNRANVLDVRFRTMAQEFKAGGYVTAGISNGGYAHSFFGFNRGFDYYDNEGGGLKSCTYRLLQWLLRNTGAPFFGWIHCWDVHFPYKDRPPYNRMFTQRRAEILLDSVTRSRINHGERTIKSEEVEYLKGMYDGAIKYVDDLIATFVQELDRLSLSENTILVITADHGEAFMEHGFVEHTECLYGEVLQVPLILIGPGLGRGRRIKSQVRLLDIMPTLLDLCGLTPGAESQGRSLLSRIHDETRNDLLAVSETERGGGQTALSDGRYKIIKRKTDNRVELYDLAADPQETTNIAPGNPETRSAMEAQLSSWEGEMRFWADRYWSDAAGAENAEMNVEVVSRLKDLGYLE